MSTTRLSNFPNAVVAFGMVRSSDLETLQKCTEKLNAHVKSMSTVAGLGPVISIMLSLTGEVDKLQKKLENLDEKLFSELMEEKTEALNFHLGNLNDEKICETQMISEVEATLSHMNELLSVFTDKRSVFRKRYYLGAPLFANFCGILKAICLMAEGLPGFNTSQLPEIKERYQEVLDWFRKRCIGRRMASSYVLPMFAAPGVEWVHDWQRHFAKYEQYYDGSAKFPWMSYGEKLGGVGWRVWSSSMWYCSIVDTWDTRAFNQVKFEPLVLDVQLQHDRNVLSSLFRRPIFSSLGADPQNDILAEYRARVHDVMEKFFAEVSLLEEVGEDPPWVEEVRDDRSGAEEVTDDLPCAEEVQDDPTYAEEPRKDHPCAEEVNEDRPCAEEVADDLPCAEEVNEDRPCAEEVTEDHPCAEEVIDSAVDRPTSLELSDDTTDSSAVPSAMPTPLQSLPTDFMSVMPTPSQDLTPGLFATHTTMTMPSPHSSLTDFQPAVNMPQVGFAPDLFPVPSGMPSTLSSPTGSYPVMPMPQVGFLPGLVTTPSSTSSPTTQPPPIGFATDTFAVPSGPAPAPPSSKSAPYPTQ